MGCRGKAPALAFLLVSAASAVAAEPAQTVSTVVAQRQSWQPSLDLIGNLRAERGADLAFEVAGIVDAIGFASGQDVAAGALLVRLRLNDEPARLAQLRAQADLAATNLGRDSKQNAVQAVSQAVVDNDRSTLAADRAQVDAEQALMEEKVLRAPFAGRLGIRQVDLGQYLQPGASIVTLQALDPMFVDFPVPQQALAMLHVGDVADVSVDAYPGRRFVARVAAISPQVDAASRSATVRAALDNHDHALVPGMFATVHVAAGAAREAVTVPQTAIAYSTYGDTVYVLRHDAAGRLVAHQVLVTTGTERGDQVAVMAGLAAGDVVVSAGQLKLHDGSVVEVNNQVQPGGGANPQPAEE